MERRTGFCLNQRNLGCGRTGDRWGNTVACNRKRERLAVPVRGFMNQTESTPAAVSDQPTQPVGRQGALHFHGVRYQVTDVSRAVAFYTGQLGFTLKQQHLPAFATISLGELDLLLSGPQASGSRPLPDGRHQESGGWNRVVLKVADLPAHVEKLKMSGVRFRNAIEGGPAGKQIQLEDPDGNPIELFEPAR
jgi:glyoxylase I family protein